MLLLFSNFVAAGIGRPLGISFYKTAFNITSVFNPVFFRNPQILTPAPPIIKETDWTLRSEFWNLVVMSSTRLERLEENAEVAERLIAEICSKVSSSICKLIDQYKS